MVEKVYQREIAEKAIEIVQKYGEMTTVEGLPGKCLSYETESLKIGYLTPFSGAEVFKGVKHYMVDIYHSDYERKKVFSVHFAEINDLTKWTRPKKWIDELFALS